MRYREYKGINRKVSALGYGCMRYPKNENGSVNELRTTRLLREAFRNGVNYYDTAYGYHDGESERVLGHAVKPFRDKVIISTKNWVRAEDTRDTWRERLDEQIERIGSPPDILNFHGLNWEKYSKFVKPKRKGLMGAARQAQKEGLFKHVAFSSHDTPDGMKKLIDTGEFVGITVQYNLLDRRNEEVIEHADRNGMGVVVMGPVGGGRLAAPSGRLQKLIRGGTDSTPEIALRFVFANPHVSCAISGMSDRKQLMENLRVANLRTPLTASAKRQVQRALQEIKKLSELYCTACGYCMPCPHGVNIPANFNLMNLHRVWGLTDIARQRYAKMTNRERGGLNASYCKQCGACMPKCPQDIDIIRQLEETDAALGGKKR